MDDADLDPELLSALRELPSLQDDASQATLDRMEALPLPQLQGALRGFLGGLSREQLDELVATSSEEEDDEEERGGGAAWPQGRVVALTPARVRCGRGHELSAIIGRPADYAGQVHSRPPSAQTILSPAQISPVQLARGIFDHPRRWRALPETGMYSPREHVPHRHNHSVLCVMVGRAGLRSSCATSAAGRTSPTAEGSTTALCARTGTHASPALGRRHTPPSSRCPRWSGGLPASDPHLS